MGKIIPFSTCLRLNRKKKRKASDDPGTTGQPAATSLTIRETTMVKDKEIPQQDPCSSSVGTDQFKDTLSGREHGIVEPGMIFLTLCA